MTQLGDEHAMDRLQIDRVGEVGFVDHPAHDSKMPGPCPVGRQGNASVLKTMCTIGRPSATAERRSCCAGIRLLGYFSAYVSHKNTFDLGVLKPCARS